MSEDGSDWKEVHRGILPNTAAAKVDIKLPGTTVAALRVRILSTHDTQAARSCGLAEVQLWEQDRLDPPGTVESVGILDLLREDFRPTMC